MSQRIYTFSVPEDDTETLKLIEQIKKDCKQSGVSFTHVCIKALKQIKETTDEQR